MFHRDEVGVRSVRAVPSELEHLRTERGKDPRRLLGRRARVGGVVHRFQIRAHALQRTFVRSLARRGEEGVGYPEAHHESAGKAVLDRPTGIGHGHRIAGPDRGDAGPHDDPLRGAQEQRGVRHRLLAGGLSDPHRAEPGHRLSSLCHRLPLELRAPHTVRAEARGQLSGGDRPVIDHPRILASP